MKIVCAYCNREADRRIGDVRRALKIGAPLYCNKACAGMGRRKPPKTIEQKKIEKSAYDARRRVELADKIKAAKAAAYQRNRQNPEFLEKQRQYRKKVMQRHLEYCRRPDYRAAKREYDIIYRAKREHGEFWESAILVLDIRRECLIKMSAYDIRLANGTYGKSQKRKREYERRTRIDGGKLEIGPLGNLEIGQKR
jgi:hypothetical protein